MSTRSDCASPSPSMTMHLVSSSHRTILPTAIFPRCACPRRGTGRSEPGHDQHLCQTLCDCNANCTAYEWGNDCYLSTGVVQPACLATDSRVNPTPHTHPTPPQLTQRLHLVPPCGPVVSDQSPQLIAVARRARIAHVTVRGHSFSSAVQDNFAGLNECVPVRGARAVPVGLAVRKFG